MSNLKKALALVEMGMYVLPVQHNKEDGTKVPLTRNGHLDASNDKEQVTTWFSKEFKTASVGVHVGRSGLVVLDRDMKVNDKGEVTKDGFASLQNEWYIPDDTFNYPSVNGLGQHDIYLAPKNVVLSKAENYRGLIGVDRWAGSAWLFWAGDAPKSRDEFAGAPEWLCDASSVRTGNEFTGTPEEWIDDLAYGEPNALVRRAIEKLPTDDLSHGEMVSLQHHAIRLGAEGNSGVQQLFSKLYQVWMNRPEDAHSTPKDKWDFKFQEALTRGISTFGAPTDLVQNLPPFDIDNLPEGVNASLLVGEPQDKFHFSKVLNHLADLKVDKDEQASILWNAPTTREWAREWSLAFVYQRIEGAEKTPEPVRENPSLEVHEDKPKGFIELLTQEERDYIAKRPTFVDQYLDTAKRLGFANEAYTRSAGWNIASMFYAFKGFAALTEVDKMGVNLWNIILGESGTGKTRAEKLYRTLGDTLFLKDAEEGGMPYLAGAENSPQGMHAHLLKRDRKPTVLWQDEASEFFESLKTNKWFTAMSHSSARWYEGYVDPTSKLGAELKGVSALTSYNLFMLGTPEYLLELLDEKLFRTGFMARVQWTLGPDREVSDKLFLVSEAEGVDDEDFDEVSAEVKLLAVDLISSARLVGDTPKRIKTSRESATIIREAHKKMFFSVQNHPKEDSLVPSVTRLAETMRKCAMICAMYRGDTVISKADSLHAVRAVEGWFNDLLLVIERVSKGRFQKLCGEMETYIMGNKGVSESKVLYRFRDWIERDPRELQSALDFIVRTGRVNKVEATGKEDKYEINGGKK